MGEGDFGKGCRLAKHSLADEILDAFRDTAQALKKAGPWAWALILFFLFLYLEPTRMVWRVWSRENGYYNHGPFVPLVSIFMLILIRKEIERVPLRPNWWGMVIVAFCSLGFLASTLCHMFPPKYLLFVFYLLGFNLLLFGWPMVKATLLPWLFLFFMTPFPDAVIDRFTYRMRLFVTEQSVNLVEPLGWFVVNNGNFILYPDGSSLVVEDVCAGLRSIIGLLALGACFSFIAKLNPLGKVVLLLLSAPIAILTNILRIFGLIVVGYYYGTQAASGKFHDYSGYAIYVMAGLLVWGCSKILEYIFPEAREPETQPAEEPAP
jgi:exosortase